MKIEETYLSIKEFAAKLNVHHSTIRRSINSGRIQAIRIGTGKRPVYRIPLSEIHRIALFDLQHMIETIIDERKGA